MDDIGLVSDRLDYEPPIFRGLSNTELLMTVIFGFSFWLPLCVFIGYILGNPMLGLGFSGLMVVVTVVFMGSIFQKIKRGRPNFYYQQKVILWMERKGLRKERFIQESIQWDIGREG